MFKVSKKIGTIIVLSALAVCASLGTVIAVNTNKALKLECESYTQASSEFGGVVASGHFTNFLAFEYHMLAGDVYRHRREFVKAQTSYGEAAKIAAPKFAARSFFTALAYDCKAHSEQKAGLKALAYKDFKAALNALPANDAYDSYRWNAERWVIATGETPTQEDIFFYQRHLALAQKLYKTYVDHVELISAMFKMARALDANGQYEASELYWKRMTTEVRAENYSPVKFAPYLLNVAYHELEANHLSDADDALAEGLTIATEAHDEKLLASFLQRQGELRLKQHDWKDAAEVLQRDANILKTLGDKAGQSTALGYLSEVARHRGDLATREQLLRESLELAQSPELKPRYLFVLACIAARRKNVKQTEEYFKQWQETTKTIPPGIAYLANDELRDLIALYPASKEFCQTAQGKDGITFNPAQQARLLSILSAHK